MEYKEIAEGVTTQNDTHDLTVTNVSPYVGWSTKRLDLWGSIGLGKGEVGIRNDQLPACLSPRHLMPTS